MSKVQESFTTKAGTRLPLLNLKGKPYMQAQHRMVWFEEENPFFQLETLAVQQTPDSVVMRTKIVVLTEDGKVIRSATAYKSETLKGFPDFIEKAETGAISRALLVLGYGTAFAGEELDERDRLADSPIKPATPAAKPQDTVTSIVQEAKSEVMEVAPPSFSQRRRKTVDKMPAQDDGI